MSHSVTNVSSVPQRSPLRYPGGKTWFVPHLREWLYHRPATWFIEPFCGGSSCGLTALAEKLADKVLLADLDDEIAALWEAVTRGLGDELANRIMRFNMCEENAKKIIHSEPDDLADRAFRTIIKNRCRYGGIMAPRAGGMYNEGVNRRWYPKSLAHRLRCLNMVRHRLDFMQMDALHLIAEHRRSSDVTFFIDPPYTAGDHAGRRLYNHNDVDHQMLFHLCSQLKGDFLMTYSSTEMVWELAKEYKLDVRMVNMKSATHKIKTEMIIGRKLDWIEED